MCYISPQIRGQTPAPSAPRLPSTVAVSGNSRLAERPVSAARRRWTTGEITEILEALATLRTSDIARALGVNPKALRSMLRRNGISLRALREHAMREETCEGGLMVRRSAIGPSATYGAAALEHLPDGACRWPIGDPAEPDFAFCGAAAHGRSPYCTTHLAKAFEREDGE